jgi:hypothetical protein
MPAARVTAKTKIFELDIVLEEVCGSSLWARPELVFDSGPTPAVKESA